MRVLRSSIYVEPGELSVMTTVMRDCDARDSLESVRENLIKGMPAAPKPTYLHQCILEVPDGLDEGEATFLAAQRMDREYEVDCALLYFWTIGHLPIVNPGDSIIMEKPAPLAAEDMIDVLSQVVQVPTYEGQSIFCLDRDGRAVEYTGGFKINGESV